MTGFGTDSRLAFASLEEQGRVQERLLRAQVAHCLRASPYYGGVLGAAGIGPDSLALADLSRLPCTGKEDLAARNDDFLAVPMAQVVDVVQSSGTTGAPTRICYTEHDLARLAYNELQSFRGVGLTAGDVVLLTCTMDRCFVAGLAYFLGLRALGAAVIRNGHGTMEGHRDIIRRMRPTAIVGVPSFLRKLAGYLRDNGMDPASCGVRRLVCIGEPVRDASLAPLPVGLALARQWGARIFSTYATSETVTTFCECEAGQGGHLHPELGLVEILDEAGCPVPEGAVGEVVLTPLQVAGMPLLRFRTGDLAVLHREPCGCGRTSPRLGPIVARRQQMIKLKGTTLYPQAIALALDEFADVGEHYLEVRRADALSDAVTVHVSLRRADLAGGAVAEYLAGRLRVRPEVVVESEADIRRIVFSPEHRKPMRFFDRRDA